MSEKSAEIRGSHNIENAAIEFVIKHEKKRGRQAQDVRHAPGSDVDIRSVDVDGSVRDIEVKSAGTSVRGQFLWLEMSQIRAAQERPETFHLYVVENVGQGDPHKFVLLDIHGERLTELLAKRKEKHYAEVPMRVGDHEALKAESAKEDETEYMEFCSRWGCRLIDAVLVLHDRGYGQFRIWSGSSPTGMNWRALVAPGGFDSNAVPSPAWREMAWDAGTVFQTGSATASYTIGDQKFGPATAAETLADAILAAHSVDAPISDPLYTGWLKGLRQIMQANRTLPLAFNDCGDYTGWQIGDDWYPGPPNGLPHAAAWTSFVQINLPDATDD